MPRGEEKSIWEKAEQVVIQIKKEEEKKKSRICPICGEKINSIERRKKGNAVMVFAHHKIKGKNYTCYLFPLNFYKLKYLIRYLKYANDLLNEDPTEIPEIQELYNILKELFEKKG